MRRGTIASRSCLPETALQAGAGRALDDLPAARRRRSRTRVENGFLRRPFHRHRVKTRLSAAFARQRRWWPPPRELVDVKTEVRPSEGKEEEEEEEEEVGAAE